jgi:hypothetical protein
MLMTESKISVVILNWLRPGNIVDRILPVLTQCPIVGEIIISHGREDTMFNWKHPHIPVHHRNDSKLNERFGLSLRFICASDAFYDVVVFIDDDLIPHPVTLINMFKIYQKNTPCLVGRFGRFPNSGNKHLEYSSLPIAPNNLEAPLLLTSLLFSPKSLCCDFFQVSAPLMEFVKQNSSPFWNGEDLTLSLMGLSKFGKWGIVTGKPKHFPVKRLRSEHDKKVAISNQSCHVPYRSELLRQLSVVLRIHPTLLFNKKSLIRPKLK